jgi:hypothetical protein
LGGGRKEQPNYEYIKGGKRNVKFEDKLTELAQFGSDLNTRATDNIDTNTNINERNSLSFKRDSNEEADIVRLIREKDLEIKQLNEKITH